MAMGNVPLFEFLPSYAVSCLWTMLRLLVLLRHLVSLRLMHLPPYPVSDGCHLKTTRPLPYPVPSYSYASPEVKALMFDRTPKTLDEHVAQPSSFAVHAHLRPALLHCRDSRPAGELAALFGVD